VTIDITGERYGRLTVIKEVERRGYTRRFLCKCDCGNEKIIEMRALRSGHTMSCGCLQRESASKKNSIDLTGKRFGKLLVIGRSDKKHATQEKTVWHCKCDCGKEIDVLSTYLTMGGVKSCGCHRRERTKGLREHNERNFRKDGVMTSLLKSKLRADNTTGHKGVTFSRARRKYVAQISIKGKRIYLGEYEKIEDAIEARKKGEEKYFQPYLDKLEKKKK